ncbi:MAG: hypothetical protein E7H89_12040 [Cutibacterium acnes]|nr:hypothetical protein [Cutibacterium acnes]
MHVKRADTGGDLRLLKRKANASDDSAEGERALDTNDMLDNTVVDEVPRGAMSQAECANQLVVATAERCEYDGVEDVGEAAPVEIHHATID